MDAVATKVVIELAKEFIQLMQVSDPTWTKAYFRFRAEETRYGSNASYEHESGVSLIGALKYAEFYDRMNANGAQLVNTLGKTRGVFLLSIDAESNYDIKFDWQDLDRWEITKLNGGSGLPRGI